MTVQELNRDQLIELKQHYIDENNQENLQGVERAETKI